MQLWCSAQEYVANANSGKFVPKIATTPGHFFGNPLESWNHFLAAPQNEPWRGHDAGQGRAGSLSGGHERALFRAPWGDSATSGTIQPDSILIVDFGSQVTQLIARRVREAGVYSEIAPFTQAEAAFQRMKPKGIILSGSPASVPAEGSPRAPQMLFEAGVPILGICYGQQVMSHQLGGEVRPGHETGAEGFRGGEFGRAFLTVTAECALFDGLWQVANAIRCG